MHAGGLSALALEGEPGIGKTALLEATQQFVLDLGEWARLGPADGGEVSGSLRLPTEALVRLFTGRLDPAHTPASTVTEGRPALGERGPG